jgi:hypothetical protein
MPMLSLKEAAGLRVVCKAMKGLVMEWPMSLGAPQVWDLEAVLTCFPATESFHVFYAYARRPPAEVSRMVEFMRGHGGTLKLVEVGWEGSRRLLSSAVLPGRGPAQPQLKNFELSPKDPVHRQLLSGGMLRLLEDVRVTFRMDEEEEVAALGHLRSLPHLRRLELHSEKPGEAAFPAFIPPSLKSFFPHLYPLATLESLLRELPSMLQASGPSLEEIQTSMPVEVSLAPVLRTCSSTLKTVKLMDSSDRLRPECIPDLVPCLMSCCATLEALSCPWEIFSALPATCPTFPLLITLKLDCGPQDIPDCTTAAWDIMANGRLPALTSLYMSHSKGLVGGHGVSRLARALEAIAGTLRRLTLIISMRADPPIGACYELGAAIGKLRRLRYLNLSLSNDGRAYHAVGRGMAASGGCPELFEVFITGPSKNLDCLTHEPSLIVPSVRELAIYANGTEEEALLLCCGLVQMGCTKYRLTLDMRDQEITCCLGSGPVCGPCVPWWGFCTCHERAMLLDRQTSAGLCDCNPVKQYAGAC